MKMLRDELKEYGLSDAQIKRITTTLESGKTVRTTYDTSIDSIFVNDEGNAEMIIITGTGKEKSIERKL